MDSKTVKIKIVISDRGDWDARIKLPTTMPIRNRFARSLSYEKLLEKVRLKALYWFVRYGLEDLDKDEINY